MDDTATLLPPAAAEAFAHGRAASPPLVAALENLLHAPEVPEHKQAVAHLRTPLAEARRERRERFEAGGPVEDVVFGTCRDMDRLIISLLDLAHDRVYSVASPTTGDRLAVAAVGGYGRGEMAPRSDIDLLFLLPYKRTPRTEQIVEFLLYKLWDLGLKVGHSVRTERESLKAATQDLTVCTALLESRLLWGEPATFSGLWTRLRREMLAYNGLAFVEAKLAERNERHKREGDSRYLLEPNVKEGKGGLRDLHSLQWIGRFLFEIDDLSGFVAHGLLDRSTLATFQRAQRFFWSVRAHLHYLTGRAEERLTFDVQPEIARRCGYRDRNATRGVERFMKRYYLHAKETGALTRVVLAALEEQQKRKPRLRLPRLGLGSRKADGFVITGERVTLGEPDLFARDPLAMLRLYRLAQERGLDIHPLAEQAVTRNLRRIDGKARARPEAGRMFMAMLTDPNQPAMTLRRLNEAGVLGRLIPEFGRIVGQMPYNLYHHYTVDEHSIFAVEVLSQIEAGEHGETTPLVGELLKQIQSRAELYLATLIHDIGKGRTESHSIVGERLARRVVPRLGLTEEQTDTVAWLVRHHLLLSETAFRRDIDDLKTVADVAHIVQSPERLRLLLILTVCDVIAVGPGIWTTWKAQLLRDLFREVEAVLATGRLDGRRAERIAKAKAGLPGLLQDLPDDAVQAYIARHDPRYWLSFPIEAQARHARIVLRADAEKRLFTRDWRQDDLRGATELMLYAPDHPGLFMKVAGALAVSDASIVGARIFTTTDGMALDTFEIQHAKTGEQITDDARLQRIGQTIEKALAGEISLDRALAGRQSLPKRTAVFTVEPRVFVDNGASQTHTVIEVNGRDRPGVLYELAKAILDCGLIVASAQVTTYGERVVDVFYVRDVFGLKVRGDVRLRRIRRRLGEALSTR
ncbi:[protein-PII] uridylyltransferase [Marinivivus vitaminiproducens]|uniref:[protein-PII] uridylyltransferase n=1 Tax=Marinivivus vitaminiproducens TaxID=3035935 RepID=UPI0027A4C0CF|nr:[protein-PII] uridylyltransferase [Geminicoccaceae bacterium SCSIO 64248]